MKKGVFITSFILLGIIAILAIVVMINSSTVSADLVNINQQNPEETTIAGINPLNVPTTPEELKNQTSQYLKKEWGKLLRDDTSTLGKIAAPILRAYDKISPYTDPIFIYTIGMAPSLTWLFILTLTLWIFFVTYIYQAMSLFSVFSDWVHRIISLGMVIVMSLIGVMKTMAEWIIATISVLTSTWMQLIAVLVVFLALIIASYLSGGVEQFFEKMKERKKKFKEEMEKEEVRSELGILKTFNKIWKE